MKLCCAVEDKNSFDRHAVAVLKDERVVGHVHVAIFCKTQQVVSQPDSSHRPRDYTVGERAESLASGYRPRSVKKAYKPVLKLFSTHLIHEYSSSTHATRVTRARSAVPQTVSSGPRGVCVMEVKSPVQEFRREIE